jgi:hypothetical protein
MRFDLHGRSAFLRTVIPFVIIAGSVGLAGCSASGSIRGPSWNLTGGRDAVPPPPKPVEPIRPAAMPHEAPAPHAYRGGRDPVTGRAPTWGGAPQGFEPRDRERPSASIPPSPVLRAAPPPPSVQMAPLPPMTSRPAPQAAAPRTVEVLPGQSLAMIAKRNNISIAVLMQANNLRDPYVFPGQVLILP